MADNYIQGSFAFRCAASEADLLSEAIQGLSDISSGAQPEPPSAAILTAFPPILADEPWSGLLELMPDPEFPALNTDFSRDIAPDDPKIAVVCFYSMSDFEPLTIAELIRGCCQQTLAIAPVGYEWASTCSRPRLDEFGGGWCAVFADRIEIENSGRALDRTLSAALPVCADTMNKTV